MLDGYVPDEATRTALLAAVRAAVPGASVEDKQALGVGAPEGFRTAAESAITQLGRLTGGGAALSGTGFSIRGEAPSVAARDEAIRRASAPPAGFTLARQEITAAPVSRGSGRWSATVPP